MANALINAYNRITGILASALAQHTVAAGEVPEAMVEAPSRFYEKGRALDFKSAPSARRRHLVGAGDGHRRADGAVVATVAAPAVEACPGGRASGAVVAARAGLAGGGAKVLGKCASGAG